MIKQVKWALDAAVTTVHQQGTLYRRQPLSVNGRADVSS